MKKAKGKMDYKDILIVERERYLAFFRSVADEYKEKPGMSIEVPVELEDHEPALFEKLYYADIIIEEDGESKVVEVDPDTVLIFKPGVYESTHGVGFELRPFVWNGCEFHFSGGHVDMNRLALWFHRWREPHPKDGPESMFSRVVHSVTEPQLSDSDLAMSVDFGSAPIEAFEEFLKILSNLGATDIRVGYVGEGHDGDPDEEAA